MKKLLSIVLACFVFTMFGFAQEKPAKPDTEKKPAAAETAVKAQKELKKDCCTDEAAKKDHDGKACCEGCKMKGEKAEKGEKAKMHHMKNETKQDIKSDAKPDVKQDMKQEAKPEVKPESKPLK